MKTYTYDYPRPAVGTDILLFSKEEEETEILLIQRGKEPFKDYWAFPGGFTNEGESCEQAAARELKEETGLDSGELFQLGVFSKPGRDPRGWIFTVAFAAWVRKSEVNPAAADDAANVRWYKLSEVPPLAFDHAEILERARTVFLPEA